MKDVFHRWGRAVTPVCFFHEGNAQMLVLTRKRGEQIMVGDHIAVTLVDIRGGKVRLGLSAPRDVPVRRAELPPRELAAGDGPKKYSTP